MVLELLLTDWLLFSIKVRLHTELEVRKVLDLVFNFVRTSPVRMAVIVL